jgi:hypothetical protein
MFRPHYDHLQANIYRISAFRHLICICWPEDGRNEVETCSQKLLNVLALTIVYFIILLLGLTCNKYTNIKIIYKYH